MGESAGHHEIPSVPPSTVRVMEPPMFAMPDAKPVRLDVRPRLASWDAAGHPGRVRLEEFLAEAARVCRPELDRLPDPLALRLDVALPPATPLLEQHDLDNYLFPLVTHLSKTSGRRFVSVWGTKRHGEASYIRVAEATPVDTASASVFTVRTTASSGGEEFKRQIDRQLAKQAPLPEGPVALRLCFRTGPSRSWPNLWKPAIDALGGLLGRTDPDRPWHPRDGRIVELGLSNHIEAPLRNDVAITITATRA
ncbi:hypothetical protein [Actinomadura sp. 3N407]|uniref:hypothetical protein n=1 Tax=Actinomadura sp. 3N407 TaxID=3457423 RepID=UPI003FCED884